LDYNTVIAVGANGYIIKTNDGGSNWYPVSSNTSNDLYKISFVNKTTGYAIGCKGTILETTDEGQSWSNIGISTNLNFFSISFINKDTGLVAGGEGDLYCPYGNKGILIRTTNGGTNWLVDSTYDKTVTSVCFIDKDTGYIALNNTTSLLQKTIDGGNSYFTIIKDSLPDVILYSDINFINSKTGYFVSCAYPSCNKEGIYKTIDYGKTWNRILTQWFVRSLYVIDSCFFFISYKEMPGSGSYGIDSCSHKTLDNTAFFWGMSFMNQDNGFGVGCCIGNNSYIYKRGLITNIKEEENFKTELFPNPFNSLTTLYLDPSINMANLIINIYNSMGQEIINKPKIENNRLIIDLTDASDGVYYLIIKDKRDNKTQSKKLIKF
jgi:photosystem II stability/assembly factor-like uncharacterized protein